VTLRESVYKVAAELVAVVVVIAVWRDLSFTLNERTSVGGVILADRWSRRRRLTNIPDRSRPRRP